MVPIVGILLPRPPFVATEPPLGWISQAGVGDAVVVIVKGAHTPHCDPKNLVLQLHQSLERLGLPSADIYIMHRDNLDIPVDEFVDVLNDQVDAGLIKVLVAPTGRPRGSPPPMPTPPG